MSKDGRSKIEGWIVCPENYETNDKLARFLADTSETYESEHHFVDLKGKQRCGYWSKYGHSFVDLAEKFCDQNNWAKIRVFKKVGGKYIEFSLRDLKKFKKLKFIDAIRERKSRLK